LGVTSGGIIATQQVADAPADGHTLLVTFDTFAVNPFLYPQLKWDPLRDFSPVMQVCRYPQVLVVHPSLGVKTVGEFVALAKERGASLNYGSAGPASSSRLAYELFKQIAGIETVPIHYRGGGPAMQDLVAGQAPAHTPKAVLERLHAGLAKLLADAGVRERLEGQSCEIIGGSPDALTELVKSEQAKWGRLIREMKITID